MVVCTAVLDEIIRERIAGGAMDLVVNFAAQLGASASRAPVISEGLLVHLNADQVRELAGALHDAPSTDGWIKDSDLNTAFGTTVDPLPFHKIKAYPYARGDAYPADSAHQRYLREYDTRAVGGR